jgi:glycine/D-amino acid oxidase-like deaminating enzyme/nitrite reductase/ring-hydroxylating ferredoxin subunit
VSALAASIPRPRSVWLDLDDPPTWPRLEHDLHVDVAIVGGGIVGVTAALRLAEAGVRVALIEANRVGHGITGHTTAKLSSLHGLTYARLRRQHGDETAQAYGSLNEAGIESVRQLVAEHAIDCGLTRKANFTYAEDPELADEIEAETEAASASGLPASQTTETGLPFTVAAAVRISDQADFHPYRYVSALARIAEAAGVQIFERSRVVGLQGSSPRLAAGPVVRAERTILATHIPFADRSLMFARCHPERSYAISLRVRDRLPEGMYLSADQPTRSIRSHAFNDGERLIVAGESHRTGAGGEPERYRALEEWARERWDVDAVEHRWSAQDNIPVDGLPFIGRLVPFSDRVLFATGFKKWGLAMGTSAAGALAKLATGEAADEAEPFAPERLNASSGAREFVSHNAVSAADFVLDRVRPHRGEEKLGPDEGRIVRSGLGLAAVYRDAEGEVHAHSARCTHLGCIVRWNAAERSWDCPCHGSRFDAESGDVLQGPAVAPLAPRPGVGELEP